MSTRVCIFMLFSFFLSFGSICKIQRGRSTERFANETAQIPSELDVVNGSIYAKVTLQSGFRFGPYQIKWTNEPIDKTVAWEVSALQISYIFTINFDYSSFESPTTYRW